MAPVDELEQSQQVRPVFTMGSHFPFDPFDESLEDFDSYIDRFECYCTLYGVEGNKKVLLLLTCIGPKVFSKLKTLVLPKQPRELSYAEITTKVTSFLNPKPLFRTERQKFMQRQQGENEKFMEFLTALKDLAKNCAYGDNLEEVLADRIIAGIRNSRTQRYFLHTPDLTYADIVARCLADELADDGVDELQGNGAQTVHKVNVTDVKKPKRNVAYHKPFKMNERKKDGGKTTHSDKHTTRSCYRCGLSNHMAPDCFHKTKTCSSCHKMGHLARVCRTGNAHPSRHDQHKKNHRGSAHQVWDVAHVQVARSYPDPKAKVMIPLSLNGKPISMELDTGATYSLMPKSDFLKLGIHAVPQPCTLYLSVYNKSQMLVPEYVELQVQHKEKTIHGRLYLVQQNYDTVMGRDWFYKLGLHVASVNKADANCSPQQLKKNLMGLTEEFADVFRPGIGQLKGHSVSLHFKEENTPPVYMSARTVPFAMRDRVEAEVERLESLGIISKTTYSEWATPVVPIVKSDGSIRLCGDYKVTLNKYLAIDEHPIPHIDDILSRLAGGKHFSKFDIRQAYMHMSVSEETSKLLTINTSKGLYRVNRLMYGVASAPALWQRSMEALFSKVDGLQVFYDDVQISSPDAQTHLARVRQFLQICRDNNLRLNETKCTLIQDKVAYLGYEIDKYGLHKTEEKVNAIKEAKRPTNVTELKSFLGLVSYYSRFIPRAAHLLHPLYKLLKKDVQFVWHAEAEAAFKAVIEEISSERVLAHYDPSKQLVLATDASSYGIGAVLSHKEEDGTENPIAFMSRSLTCAESKYSQIDKEALSIYWGVKKFFHYLYGRHFILLTDHKPLAAIFAPHASTPALSATRLLHYAIFLQGFDYTINYRSTTKHGNADFCSRFPTGKEVEHTDEPEVFQVNQIAILPVTPQVVARETKKDPELRQLYLQVMGTQENGSCNDKGEYSIQQGCLLKGIRVVIPATLQETVLSELHQGHLGIVKMKALARSYVYWKNIDQDIEKTAKQCEACKRFANQPQRVTLHPWEFPSGPWHRVHIDMAGPVHNHQLLIVVDAHSKWPEVFPMKKATSAIIIEKLQESFARFGIPLVLVSDNGPNFTSREFEDFLQRNGVKHIKTAPYCPASNGQAERTVQTVKMAMKTLKRRPGVTLQSHLNNWLLYYRKSIHATTNESPAMLMLKRNIRSRIDFVVPNVSAVVRSKQEQMVQRASQKPHSKTFYRGQQVLICNFTRGGDKWVDGKIIQQLSSLIYEVSDGRRKHRRHVNQIRADWEEKKKPCFDEDYVEHPIIPNQNNQNIIPNQSEEGGSTVSDSEIDNINMPPQQESSNSQAIIDTLPENVQVENSDKKVDENIRVRPQRICKKPERYSPV